jgi:alkaline phosphatase
MLSRGICRLAGVGALLLAAAFPARGEAKHEGVYAILMVADGAGFNTWEAATMFEGTRGSEFHDAPGWLRLAVSTHALRATPEVSVGEQHGLTQIPSLVYDPVRAWDTTPVAGGDDGYDYYFEGYRWLRHASDSANTMTALVTGRKTFIGALNIDGNRKPIDDTLAEVAHGRGLRVGTVTSVTFNHATPAAGGGAHSDSRSDLCRLAWEMLTSPRIDVIVGAGHPDFDNNGRPIEDEARRSYENVGDEQIWRALTREWRLYSDASVCKPKEEDSKALAIPVTREQAAAIEAWKLVQEKQAIEALVEGPTPERLLIVAQIGQMGFSRGAAKEGEGPYDLWTGGTLQQGRGSRADPRYTLPGDDPLIPTVPSLPTLARAAINALDDEPAGFFLSIEGGAVDWAMHANQTGRMIEELVDFKRAVAAVIEWIESGPGWDRSLLVVTADHDHLLWGPDSDRIPFQPLKDNGKGRLPSYRWLSRGHSNHLVPLFARGAGADKLVAAATREDPFYGKYLDQTDVHDALRSVIVGDASGRRASAGRK